MPLTARPSATPSPALVVCLVLLLANAALGQEPVVSGSVVAITDGDTIKVLAPGNQLIRVRLSWIDAPEKSQVFGARSKQHLSNLVFSRQVELHTYGVDQYGRTLAVVMLAGIDVNLEQVRSGMAWVFEKYIGDADVEIQASYHAVQTAAQQEQRGLWSDRQPPIPPWLYRHAARQ